MPTNLEKVALPVLLLMAIATGVYDAFHLSVTSRLVLALLCIVTAGGLAYHLHRVGKPSPISQGGASLQLNPAVMATAVEPANLAELVSLRPMPTDIREGLPDHVRDNWVVIDPAYVEKVFKESTDFRAKQVLASYVGGWIQVTGQVTNVTQWSDGKTMTVHVWPPGRKSRMPGFGLMFEERFRRRVETLNTSDEIAAVGKVDSISPALIWLNNCFFVS